MRSEFVCSLFVLMVPAVGILLFIYDASLWGVALHGFAGWLVVSPPLLYFIQSKQISAIFRADAPRPA